MKDPVKGEDVIVIVYFDDIPHDVGTTISRFDFDYTEKLGIRWTDSGGSDHARDGFYLNGFVTADPPPAKIWTAAGVRLTDAVKGHDLTEADLLALGYVRIGEPLDGNPFDIADEGRFHYCEDCDEMVDGDIDEPCDHLRYADEIGGYARRGGLPPRVAVDMRAGPKGKLP